MTRYGYPGAPAGRDEGSSAGMFAMMRSWAAGIIVLAVTSYLHVTYIHGAFASTDEPESFGGELLLSHLPNAVAIALAVWAAARIHPKPYRDSRARHLIAALLVPVTAQLVTYALALTTPWISLTALAVFLSVAVLAVGCTIGLCADRLQSGN
ncbi:hypothetical protein ACH492_06620 [Streptomyces sp. NPDC019443]|uniref:hypothetical protein n=1 Tax=Streptomyces sp. NPDC019443 TaxID=3365061 RepID=UPI0037948694